MLGTAAQMVSCRLKDVNPTKSRGGLFLPTALGETSDHTSPLVTQVIAHALKRGLAHSYGKPIFTNPNSD